MLIILYAVSRFLKSTAYLSPAARDNYYVISFCLSFRKCEKIRMIFYITRCFNKNIFHSSPPRSFLATLKHSYQLFTNAKYVGGVRLYCIEWFRCLTSHAICPRVERGLFYRFHASIKTCGLLQLFLSVAPD